MIMKIRISGIILVVASTFLWGCHSRILFEETISFPQSGWSQEQIVAYSIPVKDTINQYQLSLIIRNDARYEFSNLFLFINTIAPGGQVIRDTVEIRLADTRGTWLGKGIGGKYTIQVPFKTQVRFPIKGNYTIEIEQGMRKEELEFISDVGLRINNLE
jgi:gliding motility-associated lipoprotein GldH